MPEVIDARVEPEFADAVRTALVSLGDGDTAVQDVWITEFEDQLDEPAWRVTLVLPRPTGRTWDPVRTGRLRQRARELTDELATRFGVAQPGPAAVVITTNDAPVGETAPEDLPVPDEVATSEEPDQ